VRWALSGTAISLLVLWNIGFIFQWGTHMVPARGVISWREMTHNQFVEVPLRLRSSLGNYFFHRQDMMQQIERGRHRAAKGSPETGGANKLMAVPQTRVALAGAQNEFPSVHIAARRGWLALDLPELWAYRELLYFFVWRDLKVRYNRL